MKASMKAIIMYAGSYQYQPAKYLSWRNGNQLALISLAQPCNAHMPAAHLTREMSAQPENIK
jgi:hypothetical protein